jgi:hypothetical protein
MGRRNRFVRSMKYLFYALHTHRRRRSLEAMPDCEMTQRALIHAANKDWGLVFLEAFARYCMRVSI